MMLLGKCVLMMVVLATALEARTAAQDAAPIGSSHLTGTAQETKVALAPTSYPCVGSLRSCTAYLVNIMGFKPDIQYDAAMLVESLPQGMTPPVAMVARLCDTRVLRAASNREGTSACVAEPRQVDVVPPPAPRSGIPATWSHLLFTDKVYNGVDAALSQKRLSCYTVEWRSTTSAGTSGRPVRPVPSIRRESVPFELQKPRSGDLAGLSVYGCY